MIRRLLSPQRGTILCAAAICAAVLFSACSKKTTNVEPEPEPLPPASEPAPPPPEEPKAVTPTETSEPAPLVLENVNFDYDQSDLTPAARDILANNARVLNDNGSARVLIEGHCDERGTIEYNLALGERRADAVLRYLASLGVDRVRLSTISYGKERPVDYGHNESAWFKNRRAEFKIVSR